MAEEPFKPFVGQEHLGLVRGSWGKLGQPQGDAHHHGAAAQLRAQPGWFSVAACSRNRGWELLQPPVPMRHAQLNFCNLFVLLPGIHYCSFMAPDDLDSENYLPTSLIMFGGVRVPCWEGTPLRGALVASTGGERGGGENSRAVNQGSWLAQPLPKQHPQLSDCLSLAPSCSALQEHGGVGVPGSFPLCQPPLSPAKRHRELLGRAGGIAAPASLAWATPHHKVTSREFSRVPPLWGSCNGLQTCSAPTPLCNQLRALPDLPTGETCTSVLLAAPPPAHRR